ncbi:MAG TPA: MFS transporter [Gammaproteobacteria bacterium]|nr:MFS transporter [Gammaproteobacteria bacterium]
MFQPFAGLPAPTRRLLFTRAARSIGQGALTVDFALYLHALGWSAPGIGAVLSAGSLVSAGLSLMVGWISDRWGRKPFLLVYEVIVAGAGLLAMLTSQPALLAAAAIVGGFGRGANGSAGPFSPAEQAWLAEAISPAKRGRVYSLNTSIGFVGMGLGAVIAALVPLWSGLLGGGAAAYRPLFAWTLAANLCNFFILRGTTGGARPATAPRRQVEQPGDERVVRTENSALFKMAFSNAINGLAIGLFGPLTSYWFSIKFGVGPEAIGPVFALTFFMTGIASLWAGQLSERVGLVRSVMFIRFIGFLVLVALPLVPWYWLAATLYVARSALNRGTAGPRQALIMGLVRDQRRGVATSVANAGFQLPGSVGPTLAGFMLQQGALAMPWLLGAGLQLVYIWVYGRFFSSYDGAGKGSPTSVTAAHS